MEGSIRKKGFKISRTKTEYLICNFSSETQEVDSSMMIEGVEVPKCEAFRYLGSIIQKNGGIKEDVDHRIKAGWMKWKMTSGVLCDKRMPIKLKAKCYKTIVRPTMLYGTECWATNREHTQNVSHRDAYVKMDVWQNS